MPISSGKLLDDTGYLGATPAVKEILEGTYVYPPGMDKHTRLSLEEAALLFAKQKQSIQLWSNSRNWIARLHDNRGCASK